jgi:hypothetical protein
MQNLLQKKKRGLTFIFEIKTTTKLFKVANINMAYKAQNTREQVLRPKLSTTTDNIYNRGIYQPNCLECLNTCTGKTGRTFKTKHKEHNHVIWNNRPDTGYSRHVLDTEHTYRNTENAMVIIRRARNRKFLKSWKHYIFPASKQKNTYERK